MSSDMASTENSKSTLNMLSELYSTPAASGAEYGSTDDVEAAIQELHKAIPRENAVIIDVDVRKALATSIFHTSPMHSVIVRPQSTEEVVKVVNISRQFRIPIVAIGSATSLEGHYGGVLSGSICLDMSTMDKILGINRADADLVCQPGARWDAINDTLKAQGIPLFFPLDPAPGASIGGMISTGCSGTNAVRYGTARAEWFLNLTVVLPSGEVIKTRSRARKSSTGFDTTKLFIGAEGTLGIVTEATLRLAPVLPTRVAMVQFPTIQDAVNAVEEILVSPYGSHIQCAELVDSNFIEAINDSGYLGRTLDATDALFFKFQGAPEAIAQTAELVQTVVKKHSSTHFEFAATETEAEDLWRARKYALPAGLSKYPNCKSISTDVCVPVSSLPQLVKETKDDYDKMGLTYGIVGHVGDGNFHSLLTIKGEKEAALVDDSVARLARRAIALGGTCTGEHGIGVGKKKYLVEELGPGTVELMRTIKRAIDPLNLFNPGKLYPEE